MWNRGIKEKTMLPKLEICNLNLDDLVVASEGSVFIVKENGSVLLKRKYLCPNIQKANIESFKKFTHMYRRYECFVVEKQDKEYEFYKSYII